MGCAFQVDPSLLKANPQITRPTPAVSEVPLSFVNVSASAGITATHRAFFKMDAETGYLGIGQAWGDYDSDGWVDLYLTGNLAENVLYHNNQDGTFSVSPLSAQVSLPEATSGGVTWADYDNDGWLDLYVLNQEANVLFRNLGGAGFQDVTAIAGVGDTGKGQTAAWGDYDQDGYLDLYVVNWSCMPDCQPVDFTLHQDRLYHNSGDGTFSDVSAALVYEKLLGAGFTGSFMDYDNDGDLDIYVVNDEFKNPIGNVLWRNDGPTMDGRSCESWCWTDASTESGTGVVISGMGLAVADYDNDLDLDFYFTNMVRPMALFQNQGQGTFVNVEAEAGVGVHENSVVGWAPLFFDVDNDGWLDIFLAASTTKARMLQPGGMQDMHHNRPNYLFHNNGDGTFTDISPAAWEDAAQASMGAAYADYDNDGWVDFVVGNWNEGYTLYHNEGLIGSDNHWLTVRLEGAAPVNRDAIGARVYVQTDDDRTQMQEVQSGSSLGAGSDTALHFGLGTATVDHVLVRWPNGDEARFADLATDRLWLVTYP